MTIAAFVALPHVLVTEKGDAVGAVDDALRKQGLERRIALTVPYVLVVQSLLSESDFVTTLGGRVARMFADAAPLAVYDPPVAMPPWRMSMLWSRQQNSDAGLVWLCGLLSAAGAAV
jgi:DNA-binding transcriptional LysR family regulator